MRSVAILTSLILPSGLMVTSGSMLASMRLLLYELADAERFFGLVS